MTIARRLRFCLLALSFIAATPGYAAPAGWPAGTVAMPIYREIGDWLLGCDNTRRCVARYVPVDADVPPAGDSDSDVFSMMIVREEGPLGLQIFLTGFGSFRADEMLVDRRPAPKARWVDSDDNTDAMVVDEEAFRFLRGIVDAHELTFPSRKLRQRVSLKGLTAVLLAMDEAQGRIGNQSALVRRGSKPFGSSPRAAPPPVVIVRRSAEMAKGDAFAAAVRRHQSALLKAHECDMDPGIGDDAYVVAGGKALVVIGCGRFAYQTSSLSFLADPHDARSARLLVLPQPPIVAQPDEANAAGEYVSLVFDPAKSTLTEFSKGRGMADCGALTEWAYDGAAFRLSAFAWQQRCGGDREKWLTLYRTDLKVVRSR